MTPTTTMGGASVLPTDRPLTAGDLVDAVDRVLNGPYPRGLECAQDQLDWSISYLTQAVNYARPATSAASEVEGAVNHLTARLTKPGAFRIDDEAHLRTVLAALASPPSERERELEGADEFLAAELIRDQHGPSYWGKLTDAGREYYIRRFGDVMKRARYARIEALTAQPAGEPTHG